MKTRASKKKVLTPLLINAEAMRIEYPDTFGRPEAAELAALKVGDLVKVSIQDERFWVVLTDIKQPILEGRVDNKLFTKALKYKDIIRFHIDNIYQIF